VTNTKNATVKQVLLLACLLAAFATASSAQTAIPSAQTIASSAQTITFGPEIGPNLSGAIVKTDTHVSGGPGLGFEFGAFAELPFSKSHFSLRPRLLYSDESYSPNLYGQKYPIRVSFLKIPIDVIYRAAPGVHKWFFGVGPYLGMGLSGTYNNGAYKTDIHFGSDPDNDPAKRMDIGLELIAGYQLTEKIVLSANFDGGLINYLNHNYFTGATAHTLNLGITAGYVFGGK